MWQSKDLEPTVRQFLGDHATKSGPNATRARFCLSRLDVVCVKGPRGRAPPRDEVDALSRGAAAARVYGRSLTQLMAQDDKSDRDTIAIKLYDTVEDVDTVPRILPFLANGLLALGALQTEGIFRVPGDGDAVTELRVRIDRGCYEFGVEADVYVVASALKLWLRELAEPLVPMALYQACLDAAEDADRCVIILQLGWS